jgi:hypothetical protein
MELPFFGKRCQCRVQEVEPELNAGYLAARCAESNAKVFVSFSFISRNGKSFQPFYFMARAH